MSAAESPWTELLVCPRCRGDLSLDPSRPALLCAACALVYPIVDGVPVMDERLAKRWRGSGREDLRGL